jgi:hypothetical protein
MIRRSKITAALIVQHRNFRGITFLCLANLSSICWQPEHNIHHKFCTLIVKIRMNIHRFAFGTFEMLYGFMCMLAFTSLIWPIRTASDIATGPYKRISIKENVAAVLYSNLYNYLCSKLRKQHQLCTKHISIQLKENIWHFSSVKNKRTILRTVSKIKRKGKSYHKKDKQAEENHLY